MADNNILTISVSIVFYYTNLTREGCTNSIANIHFDVQSLVTTTPTASEVTCNHTAWCWHMEATKINLVYIWEVTSTVCIIVIPIIIEFR